jgi:hypothetical protein
MRCCERRVRLPRYNLMTVMLLNLRLGGSRILKKSRLSMDLIDNHQGKTLFGACRVKFLPGIINTA